jgi:hypothetical protein
MAFSMPLLRIVAYSVLVSAILRFDSFPVLTTTKQALFSFILFALTVARINYTENLPRGDPLNHGVSFYGELYIEAIGRSHKTS